MTDTPPLLEARAVRVAFDTQEGALVAVDGIDLTLTKGQTLALVGESGCGKSTLARALIRLQPLTSGTVSWCGEPITPKTPQAWLSRRMQMVFQDPDASLNPRIPVGRAIAEVVGLFTPGTATDVRTRTSLLLEQVGLDARLFDRYPHELSGGQKQRVCIARALAAKPELLICDEAVSALDVSIQAQILNLLADLQDTLGVSILFITHDLSVVRHIAHEVSVMYLGQVVEHGGAERVLDHPEHPYTQGLVASIPRITYGGAAPQRRLLGDIPSPTHPPSGCRFHTRCPERFGRCDQEAPRLRQLTDRSMRCHLGEEQP